jgi:polysaccharide export outer membrane protein
MDLSEVFCPLPDSLSFQTALPEDVEPPPAGETSWPGSTSFREMGRAIWRRRRLIAAIEAGLLLCCILYCLIAPKQYEADSRVELRTAPASTLGLEEQEAFSSVSVLSAPLALETLASVLRSDQLAWRIITELRLYEQPGFRGRFQSRFPDFNPERPSPAAQAWLLERFQSRLRVQTMPRTLLVEVRFRCGDAALSAAVVNTIIRTYQEQETESQIRATAQASEWLNTQLGDLKARVDRDRRRLAEFEAQHGILSTPEVQANGLEGETSHDSALLEIDELSRQLVTATTDRILSEAEYRTASQGDPEMVIAADPGLQTGNGNFATALLQQIHGRRSDLEQEQAQLSAEHGPGFPRVVEIGRQLEDLDRQKKAEDAKLVERFQSNWQTAADREQLVRKSLDQATSEGLKVNEATTEYTVMREEANASHDLYLRVLEKSEEAGLAAGVHGSSISVVDAAREPAKPVAPNLPLYLAITFFAGLWVAVGAAFLRDSLAASARRAATVLMALFASVALLHAQAPTPNTSGLPSGVTNLPQTQETRPLPNPKEAPTVWNNPETSGAPQIAGVQSSTLMAAPIGPGDSLDISEYHTPEFHSVVRVSSEGTLTLPMIGEVNVDGMDEKAAAHAIEAVLLAKGMLLHPLVSVMVTGYAGQDVSVLGEVARPGVYPYTYHHRLLDLISAAQGLSPNAGRLVNVFHASDPKTAHPVVLDPSGTDTASDHNPELSPGDTVQVSRAGLIYVVGDVIRPGGFPVDPVQGLTVVQALSLAWGPSLNAGVTRAVLIREQKGGRTMVSLNLKRMLHGQDPDQPIEDRDILYVPDSFAKNLVNRTIESALQSTIGVTIYSALVYSQRY